MSRAKTLRSSFATLRLYGPDQKGIVAACSHALDTFGFGIVQSETWTDRMEDLFFQRMLFCKHDHENKHGVVHSAHSHDDDRRIGISNSNSNSNRQTLFHPEQKMAVNGKMNELKEHFGLDCMRVNWRTKPKKIAVFVSKYDHCLWEILLRHQAKELDCEIKVVLSNHKTLKPIVETFGIPFRYFPITPENKRDQERKEIELLKNELDVDFVVLARYMQILSSQFLAAFAHDQIINIHHSFLPAFIGRSPYHQAHERGVKLIGATAHYATQELDEGPIIEQDVIQVTHRDTVSDLIRKGRIVERTVLVNALHAHLEDRVILYKNKCVVFGE